MLSAAGVADPSSFRGHSFCRGAASWAFNHGVPGELIQLYEDWTSDAYRVYLEFSVESKLAVAHQIRNCCPVACNLAAAHTLCFWPGSV